MMTIKVYSMFLTNQKRLLNVFYYMLSYLQRIMLTFEKVKMVAKLFSDSIVLYTFIDGKHDARF